MRPFYHILSQTDSNNILITTLLTKNSWANRIRALVEENNIKDKLHAFSGQTN